MAWFSIYKANIWLISIPATAMEISRPNLMRPAFLWWSVILGDGVYDLQGKLIGKIFEGLWNGQQITDCHFNRILEIVWQILQGYVILKGAVPLLSLTSLYRSSVTCTKLLEMQINFFCWWDNWFLSWEKKWSKHHYKDYVLCLILHLSEIHFSILNVSDRSVFHILLWVR